MERAMAAQHVCINSKSPSSYNVVCNKCCSSPKFEHFDKFLAHSYAEHGPTVRRSALSIIPEDNLISARGSVSHLSAHSCLSATGDSSSLSNKTSTTDFNLSSLKRPCLLDIIELLNKCFCIWHRPTRESMPRSERLYAYQLILFKLREHLPFATFRDSRSIVRQLIQNYLRNQRLGEVDDLSVCSQKQDDNENWRLACQSPALKSKIVLDKLSFLKGSNERDVEELVPDKLCVFCNIGFQNTETLWTHMVSAHLPARKLQQASNVTLNTLATESTMDTAYSSGRRSRASRSTFDTEMDATQESCTLSEPTNLRRSRRRRRGIWQNRQRVRTKNKLLTLKRLQQRRQSMRQVKSEGDSTSVTFKPSTSCLSEYSDQFLEEFIDLYHQHPCLWNVNIPEYRSRKLRQAAYEVLQRTYCQLREVPTVTLRKVKSLIRRLRTYYSRLEQPNANPARSQIWQRLAFIDDRERQPKKRRRSRSVNTYEPLDYDCAVCARKFKQEKSLAKHKLMTHPPTECPSCRVTFKSADELVQHLLYMHDKEADCPLCKEAQSEWRSAAHLGVHFYEHRCPTCTEVFRDAGNYRRHRARCRNINRFRCNHCSFKFTNTLDFRRHTKVSHQDERPFKCDDCKISFKYLAPLTKHQRLHKRMRYF
ncbi:uncharacterized protein LOC101460959 isoform X2 [Ceratitis capitata]|uniref:Zinc finger protein 471 n=2 Tax=Ceratitis capitata TaxID=7213 RepID=W8BPJ6_CERCA|nr:uncharacterized protein LOC101460959 isoform X2 [Ceratitis capitata]